MMEVEKITRYLSTSCVWIAYSFKRSHKILLLSTMFTISNTTLYIESINEFPEHYGWIKNPPHTLSEYQLEPIYYAITFFLLSTLGLAILGPQTLISFNKRIDKTPAEKIPLVSSFFQPVSHQALYHPLSESTQSSSLRIKRILKSLLEASASLYKATVATSSFAALLRGIAALIFSDIGGIPSICILTFSFLALAGNFASQLAVLSDSNPDGEENRLTKALLSMNPKILWLMIHLLTFSYNITNTALYFNAGDDFLKSTKFIDHRLLSFSSDTWWEYGLLFGLVAGSLPLFTSTQRRYSKEIYRRLQEQKPYWENKGCLSLFFSEETRTKLVSVESMMATAYKTLINSISLISCIHAVFGSHTSRSACLLSGSLLAAFCFIGTWAAQYSILKPELSKTQWEREQIQQGLDEPLWAGVSLLP